MKIPKKILMATGGSALFLASSMITHFEGLRLKPYFDGGGILSVCYGHTGNDIKRNRTYTKTECDGLMTILKRVSAMLTLWLRSISIH